MQTLKRYGLIDCFADYCQLPAGVLMDARLLMEGEALARQREEKANGRR